MKVFDELLREAGLLETGAVEEGSIEVPRLHGLPEGDAGGEASLSSLEPDLAVMEHGLLRRAGFHIEAVLDQVAKLVVKPPLGSFNFVAHDALAPEYLDDGRTHLLRLRAGDAGVYRFERGEGLCVGFDGGMLQLRYLPSPPLTVEHQNATQRLPAQSPVEALLAALGREDAWLAEELAGPLRSPLLYRQAVGYGALHRLSIPSKEEARRSVESILRGEELHIPEPAIEWIRSLAPADWRQLEREALCGLDQLEHDLRALRSEAGSAPSCADGASWQRRLLFSLHQRDALEGVCGLLAAVSQQRVLREALEAFDEEAEALMDEILPVPSLTNDPLLFRARIDSPDAWWTRV